jgi:transposase
MDPVIGLDVAEKPKYKPFYRRRILTRKALRLSIMFWGYTIFIAFIKKLKKLRVYLRQSFLNRRGITILQFLEDKQIIYYLVNPVLSYEAKKASLRKVKTDAIDAFHLGELYYKNEDLKPFQKKSIRMMNLRNLTRQHDSLTGTYVQTKLQFLTILDQVFPEYKKVFGALYSPTSLATLLQYQTPQGVKEETVDQIAEVILKQGAKRSYKWALEKAHKLKEAAERDPFKRNLYTSHITSLTMYIQILLQYQRHLSQLIEEIDALAEEFEEYEIIRSIPGIGGKIAATIISKLGKSISSITQRSWLLTQELTQAFLSLRQPSTKSQKEDLHAFGKLSIQLCNVE